MNLLQDAEFNLVASRSAQAAVLKAVKAGETTVNLNGNVNDNDDVNDNGDETPGGGDTPSGGGGTPGGGDENPDLDPAGGGYV